jgi:acylphosphatase
MSGTRMGAKKKNAQDENALIRRAIRVAGRVQGVGFRFFTRERALFRGLTGWVRNSYTGEVEAEVQGTAQQMDAFVGELWEGPLFGHISDIEQNDIPVVADESGFVVKL